MRKRAFLSATDTPLRAIAVQGEVVLIANSSAVGLSLTPEAARRTAMALQAAALAAEGPGSV
jgi:hypothetical protein